MRFRSVSTAAATELPRGECSATCLETCACSSGSPAASNSNRSLGCAARSTQHCGSRIQQADGAVLRLSAAYFDAELFAFMLPLFALILAIGSGARTLAGEEESGRLELLFAYPLRRRDGVLAKGAAVGAEVVLFAAAVFAALSLLDPIFGLDLSTRRLAGAMVGIGVLALLHGWLALAVAALTPSRALATGVPAGARRRRVAQRDLRTP
jgi:ABC-type Na+ efflux pump permease subunit